MFAFTQKALRQFSGNFPGPTCSVNGALVSGFCCVCQLFPPLVSIFGLFPVLVWCDYWLILVQPCLSSYLWFTCVFIIIIIIIHYIYIALFCFSKHSKRSTLSGGISSTTTSVQHPPGWCDGSHSAPERPPYTSLLVERRQSDEANQQIWGLLGDHDDQRTMGKFGQDAEVTPLLFSKDILGFFNDHRESGPQFNISSEGRCLLTV